MTDGVRHGATDLAGVTVDAYNAELRDREGFIGDRASNRAFRHILDDLRERFPDDEDPLGDADTDDISKRRLDRMLAEGDPEAGGLIVGAIETWAQEFSVVLRRFLRLKEWKDTERIVIGGGLRGSRVGELAIGRTTSLLRSDGVDLELMPIRHHPDDAGLIGAAHLASKGTLEGYDGILAVDIGGTNIRAGVVALKLDTAPDLSGAEVFASELWRHHDDSPDREQAVARLVEMLNAMIARAGQGKLTLAPFVGVGCPGLILQNGAIDRGGQNLPGNWEEDEFNLPDELTQALPRIGDQDTVVAMHNDAVVQGLSEAPFMRDVTRWGVMTIGTGLGNARFTNRGGPQVA